MNIDVKARLSALEPCIEAQVVAAADGRPSRSSSALVSADTQVLANAAKHWFPDAGFGAVTPRSARKAQRGPRARKDRHDSIVDVYDQAGAVGADLVLQSGPLSLSETIERAPPSYDDAPTFGYNCEDGFVTVKRTPSFSDLAGLSQEQQSMEGEMPSHVTHKELTFLLIEHTKTLFLGLPGMLAPITDRLANLEVSVATAPRRVPLQPVVAPCPIVVAALASCGFDLEACKLRCAGLRVGQLPREDLDLIVNRNMKRFLHQHGLPPSIATFLAVVGCGSQPDQEADVVLDACARCFPEFFTDDVDDVLTEEELDRLF